MTSICTQTLQSLAVFHSHILPKNAWEYSVRGEGFNFGSQFLGFQAMALWPHEQRSNVTATETRSRKRQEEKEFLGNMLVTHFLNLDSTSHRAHNLPDSTSSQEPMCTLEPVGPFHSQAIIFCPRALKAHDHLIMQSLFSPSAWVPEV